MKQCVNSAQNLEEFLFYVVQKRCIKLAIAKSRLPPRVPSVLLETLCQQCTSLQENSLKLTQWMGVYPTPTLGNQRRDGLQQGFFISGEQSISSSVQQLFVTSYC